MRARAAQPLAAALTLATVAGCGKRADELFCDDPGCDFSAAEWQRVASLAHPPPPPRDPTNGWADDPAAAQLGQRFYFSTAFSGRSRLADSLRRRTNVGRAPLDQPIDVSCATCHDLGRGGVDVSSVPGNVSVGAGVTDVNALPTLNAAYHRSVFWNGRVESLWGLNLVVAESDTTMNGSRLQTAHVLADSYGDDVQAIFGAVLPADWRARVKALPPAGKPGAMAGCQMGLGTEPAMDAYDCLPDSDRALATTLLVVWAKAIAAYERRLLSQDSAFDRFVAEGPRSTAISASARRGARLFVSKASCIDCHSGPLLSDDDFHNVGVPQVGPGVPTVSECVAGSPCDCTVGKSCFPWGAYNGLVWKRDIGPRWYPIIDAWNDDDLTRGQPAAPLLFDPALKGAWRTPSLRDVAVTAPYMHDGVYRTLEEVLWHYNTGGRAVSATAVGTPSVKLKPLGLGADEVADLAEFLKSLTGAPLPAELLAPSPAPPPPSTPDAGTTTGAPDAAASDGAPPDGAALPAPAVPAPVQAIFDAHTCATCHARYPGLPNLTDAQASYASLVGVPASRCKGEVRVVPGHPDQSLLVKKLRVPPCGDRMPALRPPLAPAEIQTIESWIAALP